MVPKSPVGHPHRHPGFCLEKEREYNRTASSPGRRCRSPWDGRHCPMHSCSIPPKDVFHAHAGHNTKRPPPTQAATFRPVYFIVQVENYITITFSLFTANHPVWFTGVNGQCSQLSSVCFAAPQFQWGNSQCDQAIGSISSIPSGIALIFIRVGQWACFGLFL